MASFTTRTIIEIFPKVDWTGEQVDHVRQGHLAAGAVSCVKSESADGKSYKLKTEWPVLA